MPLPACFAALTAICCQRSTFFFAFFASSFTTARFVADFVKGNGYFDYRRNEQNKYWMYETINEQLRNSFYNNPDIQQKLQAYENSVLLGQKTSFAAAERKSTRLNSRHQWKSRMPSSA